MKDIPRAWYVVGAIAVVIVVLAGIGTVAGGDSGDGDDNGVRVIYSVKESGNRPVSVTYENGGGNTEQVADAATTWTERLTLQPGDFVYVSAQRGDGGGTVSCSILADGQRIEEAESSGAFVIATCSGSIP